jgi:hypothetical protein
MKQAISLIEVLISILLLTFVVSLSIWIQTNSITTISKSNHIIKNNSYISMIVTPNQKTQKIFLSNKVNFNYDKARQELKNIKIKINTTTKPLSKLPQNNYIKTINIITTTYTINDNYKQKFYELKLNY